MDEGICHLCSPDRTPAQELAAPRGLYRGNINLLHFHHRIEGTLRLKLRDEVVQCGWSPRERFIFICSLVARVRS